MKRKLFLVISFSILSIFLTGCSGSGIVTPATFNQSPTASFTVNPASGVAPLEVSFNASNSSDSDGSIISYAWDFKDGNTGNGKTINHSFTSSGSYNVKLTIIDNEGATDSTTKIITVTEMVTGTPNQSPIASFTANPTSGVVPLNISFNASNSSDSDGSIINYQWDFKDGNTGSGEIINHTFSSTGSYNVKLTVTDDKGATDSTTKTITVTEPPNQSPIASFTASPTSGVVPLEVFFDASGSYDPDGNIVSYEWDFKDGNTGSGETINHTFSSTGSYNVKLTVTDDKGATDSTAKTITVTEPPNQPPIASFTANPNSGVVPLEVSFDASGSYDPDGTIVSYQWDFKDGNTGSGKTISHTFSSIGNYDVKLTVTDDKGATDSTTKTITVDKIVYRALCVGVGDYIYGDDNDLPGPPYDVDRMIQIFNQCQFGPLNTEFSTINYLKDWQATKSNILQGIASTFSGADNNDVSYFYFSGHGAYGEGFSTSYICPADTDGSISSVISVDELESALSAIPGTKVVTLDSCFSGGFIGKGKEEITISQEELESFNGE